MGTTPRKKLAELLEPILPDKWAIVSNGRTIDAIPTTVVRLRQRRISRLPQAPKGAHLVGFVVEVTVPEETTAAAEETLDAQISDVIHAIDALGIRWSGAEKVALPDKKRIGYEVTLELVSQKER